MQCNIDNDAPEIFNPNEHSDFIRDLRLSEGSAEILDSKKKTKKNLLAAKMSITVYVTRKQELTTAYFLQGY